MNHIGRLFQINIYGESHGGGVGILLDGVKPGIPLTEEDFLLDLSRRKAGGLGTTPRIEADEVHIISGVFNGYTTGAPILLSFVNTNTKSKDYSNLIDQPRPSHADYTAHIKYDGYNDYRGGGHFSGRLTLGLVSAGVVAKKMLKGVTFHTSLTNLNGCEDQSKFQSILKEAVENKDSVGGIVTLTATGLPVGLGEPYFDSLESTIAHLMFSVGGVKGIEFGIGFDGVGLKGSEFNDKIIDSKGTTLSNNNGGINGGISNGNPIVVKVFVKPTPSIGLKQETYNFRDDKVKSLEIEGRHDAAIILRAMVVLEACLAIALCDANLIRNAYKK
ncbi:chorismate synthase [Anaeroplasma bactoclasticum]|jgi:chorismate synthase|uniref:Chorismate synthase n=1 Tax=Anaeroplasma bactoclasticum TaxID=2088 RepID=A0A397RQZ8_9MOLU|nr:chorismate synthase [Anaeroplasma bactoclasticum]RIA75582.1 chorismate synthase [Anaeroplasma bactoclasticum]